MNEPTGLFPTDPEPRDEVEERQDLPDGSLDLPNTHRTPTTDEDGELVPGPIEMGIDGGSLDSVDGHDSVLDVPKM